MRSSPMPDLRLDRATERTFERLGEANSSHSYPGPAIIARTKLDCVRPRTNPPVIMLARGPLTSAANSARKVTAEKTWTRRDRSTGEFMTIKKREAEVQGRSARADKSIVLAPSRGQMLDDRAIKCLRRNDSRWVCKHHWYRPSEVPTACPCGSAGMRCPDLQLIHQTCRQAS